MLYAILYPLCIHGLPFCFLLRAKHKSIGVEVTGPSRLEHLELGG